MKKETGFRIGAGARNDDAKFKPGKSGNPKGRPPGKSLTTILNELLEKHSPSEIQSAKFVMEFLKANKGKRKVTNKEALAAKLLAKALVNGDLSAIIEIFNRAEGTTAPGKEVSITVNVSNEERAKVVQSEINKL